MDKAELIGQIIDIFEDDLTDRDVSKYGSESEPDTAEIPFFKEDEDSSGVFYGGDYYDKVAAKIEYVLKEWGLING